MKVYIVHIQHGVGRSEELCIEVGGADEVYEIYDEDLNKIDEDGLLDKIKDIWAVIPIDEYSVRGLLNQLRKDYIEGTRDDNIWLVRVEEAGYRDCNWG